MRKRLHFFANLLLVLLLTGAGWARAEDPKTIDLWPAKPPGEVGKIGEEKSEAKDGITRVSNVSHPTLTIFKPSPETNTGTAVVICPGGGYSILATSHEGEDVARWLNKLGVTGILLKYRVPRRDGTRTDLPPPQALMDAQRAMGMVRQMAPSLGIDPEKIGLMGFSAGGHLAAWASNTFEKRAYEPMDQADHTDCRPNFTILIYPAYLAKKADPGLTDEVKVTSKTPPAFLAHAGDDPVTVESSIRYYTALKRAGVPGELHVYSTGGHGFGMLPGKKPISEWPKRLEDWLRTSNLLQK